MIKTNGKMSKKWSKIIKKVGNMSKDPGLGGPLGSLCNILFSKKCNKNTCIKVFFYHSGISNKSITHSFYYYVHECSKRTYFHLSLKYIFLLHFRPYISWSCSSHDTIYLVKINQILQFSAVVICNNQYDEFLFFNCTRKFNTLKNHGPRPPRPSWRSM